MSVTRTQQRTPLWARLFVALGILLWVLGATAYVWARAVLPDG